MGVAWKNMAPPSHNLSEEGDEGVLEGHESTLHLMIQVREWRLVQRTWPPPSRISNEGGPGTVETWIL